MKRMQSFTAILSVLSLVLIVQAGSSEGFRSQLSKAANAYLQIKDALVKDNAAQASNGAAEFLTVLNKVDASQLAAELQEEWQKKAGIMKDQAGQIKSSESVEEQRAAFGKLSEALGFVAKKFGPLNTTLYRQYCPMALNKKGAQWLSSSEEIQNPYLGAKMPTCGTVMETLAGSE